MAKHDWGSSEDYLYAIQQTTDDGYILGGNSSSGISGDKTEAYWDLTYPYLSSDYWVLKLDNIGEIEWQNTIGGTESDNLSTIQQTIDGGYILGGSSWSGISGDKTETWLGPSDYWVIKLDSGGNIVWQNTIGGNANDLLRSVQQTTDGGFILGGYSYSGISYDKTKASLGVYDYWVIKLAGIDVCNPVPPSGLYADDITATGALIHWTPEPGVDGTRGVIWELSTGKRRKFSVSGETESWPAMGYLTPSTTYGVRVKSGCSTGGATASYSDYTEWHYFTTLPLRTGEFENDFILYPNPASGLFTIALYSNNMQKQQIQISITNIIGVNVFQKSVEMIDGVFSEQIDIENIADGIYTVTILADEIIVGNKKMVKQ